MASLVYTPGQILGPTDIYIVLTNSDGQRQDAYEITYAIYDNTSGVEMLIGDDARDPIHAEVGEYYADFRIPEFAPYGDYVVRWTFKTSAGGANNIIIMEFGVVPEGTLLSPSSKYSTKKWEMMQSLRIMLRDNNPDRNYRLSPPASQESLSQQTRVFGYIWEDEELSEAIERGLDIVNLYPPQTGFSVATIPRNWTTIALTAAAVYALTALSINQIMEEMNYSIGGVSLDIERSSKYQSMADSLQSRLEQMLEHAHATIKLTKGLQQNRFGLGVRSAFGPTLGSGVLSPRSYMRF